MTYAPISLREKFEKFSEQWQPKVIARMNDYEFKLARLEGEFVWHSHAETDETFIIIEGELTIDFRDGAVTLNAGEMFIVPRGVEHKPRASAECKLMLIEPAGTVNTGDAGGGRTAPNDVWI
jgi:mannose-6-phosphate isomerase-like protein (cupin superfamily)